MKKILGNKKIIFFYLFLLCISAIFIIFNYNLEKFWDITLKDILTFDIAIFFTFHLTQSKQDQRIKNEKINQILDDILQCTDEISKIDFTVENSNKQFTLLIRKINNKINVLKKLNVDIFEEDKITYIINQINELNIFVSEHIEDNDYLRKSKTTIEKWTNNVENKCDEIFIAVFK